MIFFPLKDTFSFETSFTDNHGPKPKIPMVFHIIAPNLFLYYFQNDNTKMSVPVVFNHTFVEIIHFLFINEIYLGLLKVIPKIKIFLLTKIFMAWSEGIIFLGVKPILTQSCQSYISLGWQKCLCCQDEYSPSVKIFITWNSISSMFSRTNNCKKWYCDF